MAVGLYDDDATTLDSAVKTTTTANIPPPGGCGAPRRAAMCVGVGGGKQLLVQNIFQTLEKQSCVITYFLCARSTLWLTTTRARLSVRTLT
jgi:hypothetical protein